MMHASRFDIAVVGDSLAARMAAAVLAKHGRRVIFFSSPAFRDTWHFSSLFVAKILASLGGNDRLTTAQPFQVLSRRARVTIAPGIPLSEELDREFGSEAAAITALLSRLKASGGALDALLDENGGLPAGSLAAVIRWRWLGLRRRIPLGDLATPLAGRLRGFGDPAAEWLRDLFQGLALRPLEALTVADGALLWAHATNPQGVTDETLHTLLHKRFEQFHGIEAPIDSLRFCEHGGGQWALSLQSGGHYTATQLIIGDLGSELPGRGITAPRPAQASPRHDLTSPLDGQLSSLLAPRFIPGGLLPLRVAVNATTDGLRAQIGSTATADEAMVREQLAAFLPFARYDLAEQSPGRAVDASAASSAAAPLKVPFRLGNHLYCADEVRLLPHLGTAGAALLAWTLLRRIEPEIA